MAQYDINALLLFEREPMLGNGAQPYQKLGGPQMTKWCFAM